MITHLQLSKRILRRLLLKNSKKKSSQKRSISKLMKSKSSCVSRKRGLLNVKKLTERYRNLKQSFRASQVLTLTICCALFRSVSATACSKTHSFRFATQQVSLRGSATLASITFSARSCKWSLMSIASVVSHWPLQSSAMPVCSNRVTRSKSRLFPKMETSVDAIFPYPFWILRSSTSQEVSWRAKMVLGKLCHRWGHLRFVAASGVTQWRWTMLGESIAVVSWIRSFSFLAVSVNTIALTRSSALRRTLLVAGSWSSSLSSRNVRTPPSSPSMTTRSLSLAAGITSASTMLSSTTTMIAQLSRLPRRHKVSTVWAILKWMATITWSPWSG